MSEQLPFLIVVLAFLTVPILALIKHSGYIDRISKEISAKGFKPVSIQRRWIDFDDNTATYDVEYQDEYGNGYQTSCKVRSLFLFFEGKLYWTKPLVGRDGNQMNREMTQQLLIDALRKENKQLKDKVSELETANTELRNGRPEPDKRRPLNRR